MYLLMHLLNYLDPGAGSWLIKVLIMGGVCGGGIGIIYGAYRLIRKVVNDDIKDQRH